MSFNIAKSTTQNLAYSVSNHPVMSSERCNVLSVIQLYYTRKECKDLRGLSVGLIRRRPFCSQADACRRPSGDRHRSRQHTACREAARELGPEAKVLFMDAIDLDSFASKFDQMALVLALSRCIREGAAALHFAR